MVHIATDEARAQLAELVLRASRGETILITESGRPMAKLIAAGETEPSDMSLEQALLTLRDIRSRTKLEPGHTLRELIEEGRRY
jgi:prevent-host-death family protein